MTLSNLKQVYTHEWLKIRVGLRVASHELDRVQDDFQNLAKDLEDWKVIISEVENEFGWFDVDCIPEGGNIDSMTLISKLALIRSFLRWAVREYDLEPDETFREFHLLLDSDYPEPWGIESIAKICFIEYRLRDRYKFEKVLPQEARTIFHTPLKWDLAGVAIE
ncbi:MAG: hypothetical protein V1837_06715 [Candidatus Woesearchaeota archaeon]